MMVFGCCAHAWTALRRLAPALALALAACAGADAPLRFSVAEGRVLNEFFRDGPAAAHLVLTSGPRARLVAAFPSGNSGAALWLDAADGAFAWRPGAVISAAARRDASGRMLHGVSAELAAAGRARVSQAILSSVRVIRDYDHAGAAPAELMAAPRFTASAVTWARDRIDGAPGYFLSLEALHGSIARAEDGAAVLEPAADGVLRLRVVALTGEPALTPIPRNRIFTPAAADPALRDALEFLTFEDRLLAGSWRFNTYFGRDTLMSLRLLDGALQASVVEAGLGAVLDRLGPDGEVAHEEDIGEYALLRRLRAGAPPDDAPFYDYKMIDDDFMLPIVAAHYLLDTDDGRARAERFLARRTASGETSGAALARNFAFVLAAAAPFARDPDWTRLIALKPGEYAGNWRDSEDGLGGGRFPYDVNGVFAPAALRAIARLHASGLMAPYARNAQAEADAMAAVWLREAPRLFDVEIEGAAGRAGAYARALGLAPGPARAALGGGAVSFRALALDQDGKPITVLHSDEAFALLFLDPAPAEVARIAARLSAPFPAGLMTDIGLLVANPAFAPAQMQARFDASHYHGAVAWSWHQALFAAAIERQLLRSDLDEPARAALTSARTKLASAIDAARDVRGLELWSWSPTEQGYRIEPFGQRAGDETESNAAQLWSTVYLARHP